MKREFRRFEFCLHTTGRDASQNERIDLARIEARSNASRGIADAVVQMGTKDDAAALRAVAGEGFDVVIEIQDRNRLAIHAPVADVVDSLLRGHEPRQGRDVG